MTRLEELSLNLADDVLTETEAHELESLLKESEASRRTHVQILEIEAGLRANRQNLDLGASVTVRLRSQLAESVAQGAMAKIRTQSPPEWAQKRISEPEKAGTVSGLLQFIFSGAWLPALPKRAWIPLTACLAFAIGIGVWFFGPTMGEPVLAEVQGNVSVERAGLTIQAPPGTHLQPGDRLRTETASATIGFAPEKTRLTLQPGAELRLTGLSRGKRFYLAQGKLEASVARQQPFHPMVLKTALAEARVLGTRFTLSVATNATRLEVSEGMVRFTRSSDRAAVVVPGGAYALAGAGSELAPLPLTGSILREHWTNVPGVRHVTYLMLDPRFPDQPSGRTNLTTFEAMPHQGQNYGARFRGYLHPPVTGKYTFWIAASEGAELYLSPDDKAEHKHQIGYAERAAPRDWASHSGQQSSALTLVAGRCYYIEALHKQSIGDDHLAVAWQPPGHEREIIPGEFLSPFQPKSKQKATR